MSYHKKDGHGHARPSFFWYDNEKDLKVCFLVMHLIIQELLSPAARGVVFLIIPAVETTSTLIILALQPKGAGLLNYRKISFLRLESSQRRNRSQPKHVVDGLRKTNRHTHETQTED